MFGKPLRELLIQEENLFGVPRIVHECITTIGIFTHYYTFFYHYASPSLGYKDLECRRRSPHKASF